MTDRWTDSLSDYLDGELTPEDRRELGVHLEGCADCALTLQELERVMERARTLPDHAPVADGWPALLARLVPRELPLETEEARAPERAPAPPRRVRRRASVVSFTWPQLVAAGIAIAVLTSVAFWMGWRDERRVATHAAPATRESSQVLPAKNEGSSETAIRELRTALAQGRDDLDPETVRVLELNLATIERSIREAKAALVADPANPYLRRHLQETMSRKVSLLRQATYLASAP